MKAVNKALISLYWEIGEEIYKQQHLINPMKNIY